MIDYLYNQLKILIKSLKIINIYLPNFIVRLYLDTSIFELIFEVSSFLSINLNEELSSKLKEIFLNLSFLIMHKKIEIYIYICSKRLSEPIEPIEKIRTYRYISLFDNDTNICCIRDADGLVSIVDCHNINLFSDSNTHKIALIYELARSFEPYTKINHPNLLPDIPTYLKLNKKDKDEFQRKENHYAPWLNFYEVLHKETYTEYNKLAYLDIVACCLTMKVKFSEEYRNSVISKLEDFYSKLNVVQAVSKRLYKGYDEILLLELFRPFLYVNFTTKSNHNELDRTEIDRQSILFELIPSEKSNLHLKDISKLFNINRLPDLSPSVDFNSKFFDLLLKRYKLINPKLYLTYGLSQMINRNDITDQQFNMIYEL
jgi:hypothetical protein